MPIVLVHGAWAGAWSWRDAARLLRKQGFDVYAPTMTGIAERSHVPPQNVTLSTHIADIAGLMRYEELENVLLVGHSYGAATAIQLALDHPDQIGGLVLLAPVVYSASDSVPFPARIAEMPVIGPMFVNLILLPAGRGHLPGHIRDSFAPQLPPQRYEDTMAAFGLLPKNFRAWAEERHHFTPDLNALAARLKELRVPVSIVAGDADPVTPLKDNAARLHAEIPGSMEAWYQEIGRAGRDGRPSDCVLLYEEADLSTQMEFIRWSNPDPHFYERVHDLLVHDAEQVAAFGLEWMREKLHARQKHDRRLEAALAMLERYGAIEGTANEAGWEPVQLKVTGEIPAELLDAERLAAKLKRDQMKLLALVQLVRHEGDRRQFIHDYFGVKLIMAD